MLPFLFEAKEIRTVVDRAKEATTKAAKLAKSRETTDC